MTDTTVKRLYKLAIKDDEFDKKLVRECKTDERPNFLSSKLTKVLYVAIYYGYLIGKGEYSKVKEYIEK